MTTWDKYVAQHAPASMRSEIARRTAVDGKPVVGQPMISRWASGELMPARPVYVAAFARAVGRDVLEAFVAAGFLTAEEARPSTSGLDLAAIGNYDLAEEVSRRLTSAAEGTTVERAGESTATGSTPPRKPRSVVSKRSGSAGSRRGARAPRG